jgi:hypothetical protein
LTRGAVDHLVLVNLSLERTAIMHLKDVLSMGGLKAYSPEDAHRARCEPDLDLPAGQGVLLKLTP